MSIPKDLAKKRDEYLKPYNTFECMSNSTVLCTHDVTCAFNAGVLAAFESEHVLALVEALEKFKLGHEHAPDLEHIRAMGDTYGWCSICSTKVSWGSRDAEQALAKWSKRNE